MSNSGVDAFATQHVAQSFSNFTHRANTTNVRACYHSHVNRILTLPLSSCTQQGAPAVPLGTIKPTGNSKLMNPNAQSPLFIWRERFSLGKHIWGVYGVECNIKHYLNCPGNQGGWRRLLQESENLLYTRFGGFGVLNTQCRFHDYIDRFVRGGWLSGVDCLHPCRCWAPLFLPTIYSTIEKCNPPHNPLERCLRSIERTFVRQGLPLGFTFNV